MEYKAQHTEEEFEEVIEWFKARLDRLPKDLWMNQATYIPELRVTVERYFDFVHAHHADKRFCGQLNHLFNMREVLQGQGFE